jgi:hypothetical protein
MKSFFNLKRHELVFRKNIYYVLSSNLVALFYCDQKIE